MGRFASPSALLRAGWRRLARAGGVAPEPRSSAHTIGGLGIALSAGHPLPRYQAEHPLYDRFLPLLVAELEAGDAVVDVGANCGDTLAAMFAVNPRLRYLCIEADAGFFALLKANAARIAALDPAASIAVEQALVGEAIGHARLEGAPGTRHAVSGPGPGAMTAQPLCAIVDRLGLARPRLIKSDVDGLDFDVIASAGHLLAAPLPLLYFECQFDAAGQRQGFETLFGDLARRGYDHWVLFDNFGNPLFATAEARQLPQFLDYVERQNRGRATRTIYYYDILASGPADRALVERALDAYRKVAG